jgi:hypothetical protein
MMVYHCDGCGRRLARGDLRYDVRIEVKAAYDELEISLADLVRDHRQEMIDLINQMEDQSAEEVEKSVWKAFNLHLCPSCQRAYVSDPMRFHPEQADEPKVDIDDFLRSLGKHKSGDDK